MLTARNIWLRKHADLGVLFSHGASYHALRRLHAAGVTREQLTQRIRDGIPIQEITEAEREALRRALAERKEL
jgi:hypothetical protein